MQNNLPLSEVPRFGSDIPEADLRPKFLVQSKKLCEQVTGIIRNIAPNEEKAALVQSRHSNELQFPAPPVQVTAPHPKPPKPKPENLEDELTPVICSLIADLQAQNIVRQADVAAERVGLRPQLRPGDGAQVQESQRTPR